MRNAAVEFREACRRTEGDFAVQLTLRLTGSFALALVRFLRCSARIVCTFVCYAGRCFELAAS